MKTATKEKKRKKRPHLTAKTADKHVLYEKSVQSPDSDVEFFDRVFEATFGELPISLREDFCGTAALCCEWARTRQGNVAIGVDLDDDTLEWGRQNHIANLGPAADRVTLFNDDVLKVDTQKVDIIAALNFSYFTFKKRAVLLDYFKAVHRSLEDQGIFVLYIMGGPEAQVVQIEETEHDAFTYSWDQDLFNPVTHDFRCYIHFEFPDGSKLQRAFTYDWRLWMIAEIRDLLEEAGFERSDVYWEGTDEDGEGDGDFQLSSEGDDSEGWIAYIVAKR